MPTNFAFNKISQQKTLAFRIYNFTINFIASKRLELAFWIKRTTSFQHGGPKCSSDNMDVYPTSHYNCWDDWKRSDSNSCY